MKHAIMIMGYGDGKITQKTIDVLDDPEIDFFIHWDKKFSIPEFKSQKSKIHYLKNRKNVRWGTDLQTIVEKKLMETVYKIHEYDYVHLISSNDMPLMTADYFKKYFKNKPYALGFLDYLDKRIYRRMNEYFPIRYLNVRGTIRFWLFIKGLDYLNRLFHVNRVKNKPLEKGCNWFSMRIDYVKRVLEFKDFGMFMNTFTGDEFYVQTALHDLKPKSIEKKYDYYSDDYRMTRTSAMASRYINWMRGHGKPYVFQQSDAASLQSLVNTKYAFGRKLNDPKVIDLVFSAYDGKEKEN